MKVEQKERDDQPRRVERTFRLESFFGHIDRSEDPFDLLVPKIEHPPFELLDIGDDEGSVLELEILGGDDCWIGRGCFWDGSRTT